MRTWAVAGAVLAARVSRFADLGDGGLPSVAFGELPGGRPSVFGESLEAPGGLFYVCEQTVRFPLLGCPRVRSGRRAGRWVTGSRLDRVGSAVRCSLALAAMYAVAGRPGPRASDVRVELLGASWTGWREPSRRRSGVPSLYFLSFSLQQWSIWRGRVTPTSIALHLSMARCPALVLVGGGCVS